MWKGSGMKRKVVSTLILSVILGFSTITMIGTNVQAKQNAYLQVNNGQFDILILVNDKQFDVLRPYLEQYVRDIKNHCNKNVAIVNGTWTDHYDVRAEIRNIYESNDIQGCMLIGNIPWAYYVSSYYVDGQYKEHVFPCDVYYMDLNGIWEDTDNDGVFDNREDPDDVEIWICRLLPPTDNDTLLEWFFEKDHAYWTGEMVIPKTALVFQENDGEEWGPRRVQSLKPLYEPEEIRLICLPNETSKENYIDALRDPYQLVWINAHGWSVGQSIVQPDGTTAHFQWDDARDNIEKGGVFYLLHSCYTGNFEAENYLTGYHIFGNGYALGCLSSTTVYESISPQQFVQYAKNSNVGEAFFRLIKDNDIQARRGDEVIARCNYYAATLVGDPMVILGTRAKPANPVEATQELIETVETWNLHKGTENSLKAKLKVAIHMLDVGKEDGAIRKLMAFINRVERLREKTLTNGHADYLTTEAQRIRNLIRG